MLGSKVLTDRLVAIECTKDGVKFSAAGDIGSGSVHLRANGTTDKDEKDAVDIDLTEPVSLTFSLKYLVNFCKASGLSDRVTLSMSDEVPLLVDYPMQNDSHLRFFLAPKVSQIFLLSLSNVWIGADYRM